MVGNISTLWLFNIAMGKQSINGPWLPWRTVSHNQRVSQWKSPFTVHGVSMDHGYQGRKLVCVFRKSHIKELSEKTKTNLLRISEAIILCLTMSFAQFYHAHANVTITVDIFKHIIIGYYCDEFARYSISEFSLHITYINHWATNIDHTVIILYRTILLFAIIFVVYCYSSIVVVITMSRYDFDDEM